MRKFIGQLLSHAHGIESLRSDSYGNRFRLVRLSDTTYGDILTLDRASDVTYTVIGVLGGSKLLRRSSDNGRLTLPDTTFGYRTK